MKVNQWMDLLNEIGNKEIELPTTPLTNSTPKWFKVEKHDEELIINMAINNKPSCKISASRILNKDEFMNVLPYYYRRKYGEKVSQEVTNITFNQVYYYSLSKVRIHWSRRYHFRLQRCFP